MGPSQYAALLQGRGAVKGHTSQSASGCILGRSGSRTMAIKKRLESGNQGSVRM
jgi:hypothetical protein